MKVPTLVHRDARKESIINNTPAIFPIASNEKANGSAPWYEVDSQSDVGRWCSLIIQISNKHGVESRLTMAIMYMETTHGYYEKFYPDALEEVFPMRKSVLPMNIHYRYWRKLGVTKENLNCPHCNIEFGVILLKRIRDRIEVPSVAKVASIYNFLGAEKVTDYGARVAKLYLTQPWKSVGCIG
jgi:hypothetical protein